MSEVDRHNDVPGGVVSEIRLVNGKPLLRAGKLATADACCEQCDCDMDALVASGKTVTVTATFNLPAGAACPPAPFPQQNCQCPQGAYTATADLVYGAIGATWFGALEDVTVDGVTCSIVIELFCQNCEWCLYVRFYTFDIFGNGMAYNCTLYSPPNLNPAISQGAAIGIAFDLAPLESKMVDGVCVPKDTAIEFNWPELEITATASITVT